MIRQTTRGQAGAEACLIEPKGRRHGVSRRQLSFRACSRQGGMEPGDAERLRRLEQANDRLKRQGAGAVMDASMLGEMSD